VPKEDYRRTESAENLGNVILSTDTMTMETDSVYQFADRNLLMAFNSQIETENEMIWADTLYH
jgi:hypothetical protein